MNSVPTAQEDQPALATPERKPLQGATLHIVRVGWIVLAVISLGLFALSIPYHIIHLGSSMSISLRIALMQHNLPVSFYIAYEIILDSILVLGFSLTAVAIFKHKSNDWMTIFVALALITFGVTITSIEGDSSPLNSLRIYSPVWSLPITVLQIIGLGSILLVFYLFPTGNFVPRWTRPLAYLWGFWLLAWAFLSGSNADVVSLTPTAKFIMRMLVSDTSTLGRITQSVRVYSLVVVLCLWFGSGIFAQIYRYLRASTPLQRRQTKWAVLGLTAAVTIYFWARLVPPYVAVAMNSSTYSHLQYELITLPISTLALLLIPISISISIQRFRLWDVDFLINRTLVYGILTAVIGLGYLIDVIALQFIFTKLTGNQSTIFITISTLVIFVLFQPLYRWIQGVVDRRFFRATVNFRQAFTGFAREVRTIIDLDELLLTLVDRTTELLAIEYGAVFLQGDDRLFSLSKSRNLPREQLAQWQPDKEQLERLQSGLVVSQPKDTDFPMLVPLIAPQPESQASKSALLGVLTLGPMCSGLHFSREDQALLLSLADQAGTAIYVARLIQKNQAEVQRRMAAEQHLEAYRSSPIGRAEALAQSIIGKPESALIEIHQLAQKASKEPECASLIGNLPKMLQSLNAGPIAMLAEGYNYLYDSQFTPELFLVGLRTLISALGTLAEQNDSLVIDQTLVIYQVCLDAYDANSTSQIMDTQGLGIDAWDETGVAYDPLPPAGFLSQLADSLRELRAVTDALYAYERVDNAQDKLAYLASAVNALRHVDHIARTELGSADRPIIENITQSWLSIVTNAMSELQTSARIVCQLLTRNTWQGDVISLVLSLRNMGRGVALHIRVTLAPAPEYTLVDETALVERLAPGEEAQVQLRVRPRLSLSGDHFRARFIIYYTDPRGPDQVENFADVVHLMVTGGEFQFIPNPYVVGTPLQTGSPLFFGREDVVKFIQANLSASHRNNLVLIGQRRTGKTSLLKQLPQRLSDDTLPVYLDGQTLGLDPGMPNFFLTLATEIAFALEDRAFEIKIPELNDFQASPSAVFEREFLVKVRHLIGERHLLIMFDEFEELETAVQRGNLESSIFGFLRHLIQHTPNLSVIFCGTHRLEQLAADYWNILFNISLYQHIAFLESEEALRLIQEPVASYGMRYDDLALDKIWRVTAGHPYFLQLLCHSLVNHHNKTQRNYVTIADVNAALDEILASGEAHFVYLWTEASSSERLVLTALSRVIPLTGQTTSAQLIDFFEERGITIERQAIQAALHQLMLRDILQSGLEHETPGDQAAHGDLYRWKLGLLGLWVEKYKSLSRVVDEASAQSARP
ncbi:MAG: AAA family ATPase [Chloroflexota bacterium]